MENVFLELFNMSITASWLVLAIIIFRVIFKKAPKWLRVVVWGLVGFRLICPFSFESVLSLIPSAELVPPEIVYSDSSTDVSGAEIFNAIGNNQVSFDLGIQDGSVVFNEYTAPDGNTVNPLLIITYIASIVWLVGMAVMLLYTLISYLRILKKVREATPLKENIWICDNISTPFILGLIKPRIFLPSSMNEQDTEFVIAHEKAHLKRHDHWWKPLGFALLTVYWFNPVLWVAYVLLCRDIELACDEKVIKEMGTEIKKSYSDALINCSVPRKMISACPLAFGETGVKGRIKSVLNYKKPAFWVIVVAVVAVLVTTVCFMTNPDKDDKESTTTTTESTTLGEESTTKGEESTTESTTEESTTDESTTEEYIPKPLTKLTEKKMLKIKQDYLEFNKDLVEKTEKEYNCNVIVEDVHLSKYYGTYGDCVAMMIDSRYFGKGLGDAITEIQVGDYLFTFSTLKQIDIYRNGKFVNLDEAYKKGWLSDEEVRDIHYYHSNKKYIEYDFYNPTPITPLSTEKAIKIKQDYLTYKKKLIANSAHPDEYDDLTTDDIKITEYMGTYKSSIVVRIIDPMVMYPDVVEYDNIANYKFRRYHALKGEIMVYRNGEFTSLEKAYEKGWVSKEDVRDIHYYYSTDTGIKNIYTPSPLVPLTAAQELKIKQDFLLFHKEKTEKYGSGVDDISISEYYGTYNGCSVMFIDTPWWAYAAEGRMEVIAGYEIRYGSYQTLDVYRNGEFASLTEAYNRGWLSKEDIKNIYYHYYAENSFYYEVEYF